MPFKEKPAGPRDARTILKEFNAVASSILRTRSSNTGAVESTESLLPELSKPIKDLIRNINYDSDLSLSEMKKLESIQTRLSGSISGMRSDKAALNLSKLDSLLKGERYQRAVERISGLTDGLKELSEFYAKNLQKGTEAAHAQQNQSLENVYKSISKAISDIVKPYEGIKKEGEASTDGEIIQSLALKESAMAKDLKLIKTAAELGQTLDSVNKQASQKAKENVAGNAAEQYGEKAPESQPLERKITYDPRDIPVLTEVYTPKPGQPVQKQDGELAESQPNLRVPEFLKKKGKVTDITEKLLDKKMQEGAAAEVAASAAVQKTKERSSQQSPPDKVAQGQAGSIGDQNLRKKTRGPSEDIKAPLTISNTEFSDKMSRIREELQAESRAIIKYAERLKDQEKRPDDKELRTLSRENVSLFIKLNFYHKLVASAADLDKRENEKYPDYQKELDFLDETAILTNRAIKDLAYQRTLSLSSTRIDPEMVNGLYSQIPKIKESAALGMYVYAYEAINYRLNERNDELNRLLEEQIMKHTMEVRKKLQRSERESLERLTFIDPDLPSEIIRQVSKIALITKPGPDAGYPRWSSRGPIPDPGIVR